MDHQRNSAIPAEMTFTNEEEAAKKLCEDRVEQDTFLWVPGQKPCNMTLENNTFGHFKACSGCGRTYLACPSCDTSEPPAPASVQENLEYIRRNMAHQGWPAVNTANAHIQRHCPDFEGTVDISWETPRQVSQDLGIRVRSNDKPSRWTQPDLERPRRVLELDNWLYRFDNDFARSILERYPVLQLQLPHHDPSGCCRHCDLMLSSRRPIFLSQLRAAEEGCQLCELLLDVVDHLNADEGSQIIRDGSGLTLAPADRRVFRLCTDLEDCQDDIPIGFPASPTVDSCRLFSLILAWIQRCDEHHDCYKPTQTTSFRKVPTRLVCVGCTEDAKLLRLVPGYFIGDNKYVALSHCWGLTKAGVVPAYCTTKENIASREAGFSIDELPLTFRDAIEVVRSLGLQFLWIDSICIIQNDTEDWDKEAVRMQDVYSSAYITVAATSADSSETGFLQQRECDADYVHAEDDWGRRLCVSADIANFDSEVEKASLNTRAWVMQERCLSVRTIHFGPQHVYWECGEGVYCDDLTLLRPGGIHSKFFRLDPHFPKRLLGSGYSSTHDFVQKLVEEYSERQITKATDRAVALSGLTSRIATALRCEERYGVFELFLRRNLLWYRNAYLSTQRIVYKTIKMPSWSWMAYGGGITFVENPIGDLDQFDRLRFDPDDKNAIVTDLWEFDGQLGLEPEAVNGYRVLDSGGMRRGSIQYDADGLAENFPRFCVVVARLRQIRATDAYEFYVLLVRPGKLENEYERSGIGLIQEACISFRKTDIRLF